MQTRYGSEAISALVSLGVPHVLHSIQFGAFSFNLTFATTARMYDSTSAAPDSDTTPLLSRGLVSSTDVDWASGSSDHRPRQLDVPEERRGLLSPKLPPPEDDWYSGSKLSGGVVDWFFHRLTGRRSAEVSLRLQNSGSVARDHLALERTFLAYMRTSLAIASAGVALVQLFNTSNTARSEREDKLARPLGAFIIAVGLSVLGIGLGRYFTVQSALVKGAFPVARLSTAFIAVVLIVLVTAAFSLLLGGKLKLG